MSIDKISALLAKAENTDNDAEAEAYMSKAQMLATRYSIDLAVARARVAKTQRREVPGVKRVQVAEETGKDINKQLVALLIEIANANDLRCTIAYDNRSLTLFGFPSDAEVAEAMFASLAHQMVEAATRYIKGGEWKGQTYETAVRVKDPYYWGHAYTDYVAKKYTARSARNAFYGGWIQRMGQRLRQAQRDAEAQAAQEELGGHIPTEQNDVVQSIGTALVLKTKREEVGAFYKEHTSHIRGSWKGSNAASGGSAHGAGRAAANNARISSQRGISGKRGAIA